VSFVEKGFRGMWLRKARESGARLTLLPSRDISGINKRSRIKTAARNEEGNGSAQKVETERGGEKGTRVSSVGESP